MDRRERAAVAQLVLGMALEEPDQARAIGISRADQGRRQQGIEREPERRFARIGRHRVVSVAVDRLDDAADLIAQVTQWPDLGHAALDGVEDVLAKRPRHRRVRPRGPEGTLDLVRDSQAEADLLGLGHDRGLAGREELVKVEAIGEWGHGPLPYFSLISRPTRLRGCADFPPGSVSARAASPVRSWRLVRNRFVLPAWGAYSIGCSASSADTDRRW